MLLKLTNIRNQGFSFTELTTTLAIIGVISAALIAVMNNLNQQSERMNTQTDLLVAGAHVFNLIDPWAALAGDKQSANALTDADALRITNDTQISFCYDTSTTQRELREFRVYDKRLQTRTKTDATCTPDGTDNNWENLTEQVVQDLRFTRAEGSDYSLDVVLDLSRFVTGSDENVTLRMRKRFNLFSLARL